MIKKLSLIIMFLLPMSIFCQQLSTTTYGSVLNSEKTILKSDEVKQLLANYPEQLKEYSSGIKKRNTGNIFIYSGVGLIFTDLLVSLGKDLNFPSTLSAIGFGAIAVGVPIKIGYSKKIKNAIDGYNLNKKTAYSQKLELIGNNNGLGLKLTFN